MRIRVKGAEGENLSDVFTEQHLGVTQAGERIGLVTFILGTRCFYDEKCRLEPIESPFGPKVLPMSSE
jgi:putative transposase